MRPTIVLVHGAFAESASWDRIIPAELEYFMAQRAGADRTIEIPGASHAVPVAHPDATGGCPRMRRCTDPLALDPFSPIGISPIALAARMKKKKVRTSGVQLFTHLRPTLGCTISSRTNSTTASRPFMNPEGMRRSCFK